jgi:hypothetical protein
MDREKHCLACGAAIGERHRQSYGAPWIDQAGGTYHDCPIGGLYGKVKEGHCRPSLWNRFLIWSTPGYFNGTNAKESR